MALDVMFSDDIERYVGGLLIVATRTAMVSGVNYDFLDGALTMAAGIVNTTGGSWQAVLQSISRQTDDTTIYELIDKRKKLIGA